MLDPIIRCLGGVRRRRRIRRLLENGIIELARSLKIPLVVALKEQVLMELKADYQPPPSLTLRHIQRLSSHCFIIRVSPNAYKMTCTNINCLT
jgi:hypothetical protein